MPKLSWLERKKFIEQRLSNPVGNSQGRAARQKAWQIKRRIALELREAGRHLDMTDCDVSSRATRGYGGDIIFSPAAWGLYGKLWIGCVHCSANKIEEIFNDHAGRSKEVQASQGAIPIVVHRCDYQSTQGTLRQTDFVALFGSIPVGARNKSELITVEWEVILEALSLRLAKPTAPDRDRLTGLRSFGSREGA